MSTAHARISVRLRSYTKPFLYNLVTGKEINIVNSRMILEAKVNEASLSPQHVKGHFLRIVRETSYANSQELGSITVGILWLLAFGTRWMYVHP